MNKRLKIIYFFCKIQNKKCLNKWLAIHSKLICTWEACQRRWLTADTVSCVECSWTGEPCLCSVLNQKNDKKKHSVKYKQMKEAEGNLRLTSDVKSIVWILELFSAITLIFVVLSFTVLAHYQCSFFPLSIASLWMDLYDLLPVNSLPYFHIIIFLFPL